MNRDRLREFGTPTKGRELDLSAPLTNKRPRQLVFDDSSDESPPTSHGEDESFESTLCKYQRGKSEMSQLAKKGRFKFQTLEVEIDKFRKKILFFVKSLRNLDFCILHSVFITGPTGTCSISFTFLSPQKGNNWKMVSFFNFSCLN